MYHMAANMMSTLRQLNDVLELNPVPSWREPWLRFILICVGQGLYNTPQMPSITSPIVYLSTSHFTNGGRRTSTHLLHCYKTTAVPIYCTLDLVKPTKSTRHSNSLSATHADGLISSFHRRSRIAITNAATAIAYTYANLFNAVTRIFFFNDRSLSTDSYLIETLCILL